jgi:hypothetical protein
MHVADFVFTTLSYMLFIVISVDVVCTKSAQTNLVLTTEPQSVNKLSSVILNNLTNQTNVQSLDNESSLMDIEDEMNENGDRESAIELELLQDNREEEGELDLIEEASIPILNVDFKELLTSENLVQQKKDSD